MEIEIAPRFALGYAAWWMVMHPCPLVLDEFDSGSDDEASQPLEEEDLMNVDNLIHDGPSPLGGLEVLAIVTPIPCKKTQVH